jgi:hypothetical protein
MFRDDVVVPFKLGQALHKAALTSRQPDWPEVSPNLSFIARIRIHFMQIRIRIHFMQLTDCDLIRTFMLRFRRDDPNMGCVVPVPVSKGKSNANPDRFSFLLSLLFSFFPHIPVFFLLAHFIFHYIPLEISLSSFSISVLYPSAVLCYVVNKVKTFFAQVEFVEFEGHHGYAHKYICRAPELPAIIRSVYDVFYSLFPLYLYSGGVSRN